MSDCTITKERQLIKRVYIERRNNKYFPMSSLHPKLLALLTAIKSIIFHIMTPYEASVCAPRQTVIENRSRLLAVGGASEVEERGNSSSENRHADSISQAAHVLEIGVDEPITLREAFLA